MQPQRFVLNQGDGTPEINFDVGSGTTAVSKTVEQGSIPCRVANFTLGMGNGRALLKRKPGVRLSPGVPTLEVLDR